MKTPETTTKKHKNMGLLKGQHPNIGALERAEARIKNPKVTTKVFEDGSVKVTGNKKPLKKKTK